MPDKNSISDDIAIQVDHKPWVSSSIRFGFVVFLAFVLVLGLWAYLAPIESAAIAQGKIIVAGHRRTIEHLEGGIIQTIHVNDGAKVKKGQVVISLDDVRAKVMLQMQRNEVNEYLAVEARLKAERDHDNNITFPERLLSQKNSPKVREILQSQTSIFKSNQTDLDGNINILNQRIAQLNQQIKGLGIQTKAYSTQLKLVQKEIKSVKFLVQKKLMEEPRLLSLQRDEAKLEGSYGNNISQIALTHQKIGETKLEISSVKAKRRTEVLTELRKTQQKLAQSLEKEKAAADGLMHTQVRAPLDGFVVNSKFHTIGGVVSPGDALMDVVPTQEALVIETEISPLDIDVVHKGLIAKVGLSSFKQRSTPTLLGTVTQVSADALENPKTGEAYYKARIVIPPEQLKRLNGKQLHPGMPVQVMIITNKLSPFEYLLSPIKDSFYRAFRED